MGSRDSHNDGDLPDPEPTDPVPKHDLSRPESSSRVSFELLEPSEGRGPVDFVVERHDPTGAGPARPDAPGEQHHASCPFHLERPHRVRHGERVGGEQNRQVNRLRTAGGPQTRHPDGPKCGRSRDTGRSERTGSSEASA